MKTLLSTITLFFILSISVAQSPSDLQQKAEEAFNAYKFDEAIELAEKALKKAEAKNGEQSFEYQDIKHDLGLYYGLSGSWDIGLDYVANSTKVIKELKGSESKEYTDKLALLAIAYMRANKNMRALETLNEVLPLSEKIYGITHMEYGYNMNNYAYALSTVHQYKEAEQAYLKCLTIFEENGLKNTMDNASLLHNFGDLYVVLGNYKLAERRLKQAITTYKKSGSENTEPYANCLYTVGNLYVSTFDLDKAIEYYEMSGEVYKEIFGEQSLENAKSIAGVAKALNEKEQYFKSEQFYRESNAIRKQVLGEKDISYWKGVNSLAAALMRVNDYSRATSLLEDIILKNKDVLATEYPTEFVVFASNLGICYMKLGFIDEAERLYNDLLSIQAKILGNENHFENVYLLNNIAIVKIYKGSYGEAEEIFKKCLSILKDNGRENTEEYVEQLMSIGSNYLSQGKYSESLKFLNAALKAAKKVIGTHHLTYNNILIELGWASYKMGDLDNAEKYFREGALYKKKLLQERIDFMPTILRRLRVQEIYKELQLYYQLILKRKEQNLINEMYDNQITMKSIIISAKIKIKKQSSSSNDQAIKLAYDTWIAGKEKLNKLYSFSSQKLKEEHINLDSIEQEVNVAEVQLASSINAIHEIKKYDAIAWQDIQKTLRDDEAAIEIVRCRDKTDTINYSVNYAVLILTAETNNGPELVVLEDGEEMDDEWSDNFYYQLFQKEEDTVSYNRFWKKIANAVSTKNKLYISRSGIYNILNISTFKNPETGKYVLEEKDIILVGNTRDIIRLKEDKTDKMLTKTNKNAVLFGHPDYYYDIIKHVDQEKQILAMAEADVRDFEREFKLVADLPGTKDEVIKIDSILQSNDWNTAVYTETEALEQRIKAINSPGLLHVATHGFYEWSYMKSEDQISRVDRTVGEADPLHRSGLMLAGAGFVIKLTEGKVSLLEDLEDGILSGHEAAFLNIDNTDLVVLSACLSGVGTLKTGTTESFAGLLQAFILAGAKAVVTSGWAVDDAATKDLMTLFYSNLMSQPKREALRNAQFSLKEKYPEPYYWGAFTMIGQ